MDNEEQKKWSILRFLLCMRAIYQRNLSVFSELFLKSWWHWTFTKETNENDIWLIKAIFPLTFSICNLKKATVPFKSSWCCCLGVHAEYLSFDLVNTQLRNNFVIQQSSYFIDKRLWISQPTRDLSKPTTSFSTLQVGLLLSRQISQ